MEVVKKNVFFLFEIIVLFVEHTNEGSYTRDEVADRSYNLINLNRARVTRDIFKGFHQIVYVRGTAIRLEE